MTVPPLTPHQRLVRAHRAGEPVSLSPDENGLLLSRTPEIRRTATKDDARKPRQWRGKAVKLAKEGGNKALLLKLQPGEKLPITKRSQVISLRQTIARLQKEGVDIALHFVSEPEGGHIGYVVAGTEEEIAPLRKVVASRIAVQRWNTDWKHKRKQNLP